MILSKFLAGIAAAHPEIEALGRAAKEAERLEGERNEAHRLLEQLNAWEAEARAERLATFAQYIIDRAPDRDPTDEEIEDAQTPLEAGNVAVKCELSYLASRARKAMGDTELPACKDCDRLSRHNLGLVLMLMDVHKGVTAEAIRATANSRAQDHLEAEARPTSEEDGS
jgi:hypothetical protein